MKCFWIHILKSQNVHINSHLPAGRLPGFVCALASLLLAQGVNTVGCGNEHEVHTEMESNCTTKDLARFFIENPKSPKWRNNDFCVGNTGAAECLKVLLSRLPKGASLAPGLAAEYYQQKSTSLNHLVFNHLENNSLGRYSSKFSCCFDGISTMQSWAPQHFCTGCAFACSCRIGSTYWVDLPQRQIKHWGHQVFAHKFQIQDSQHLLYRSKTIHQI